jgi:predicted hydrocarbon binding protein
MLRSQLGEFTSIICFKAAIVGLEEALGEKAAAIALTSAGRSRGQRLAHELGIVGTKESWDVVADKLNFALGINGTRLCIVEKIVEEGDKLKVYTNETLCSAGEEQGSNRKCTYTMGAIWGAVEQVRGKRYRGKHTESILHGASYDVFEFTVFG